MDYLLTLASDTVISLSPLSTFRAYSSSYKHYLSINIVKTNATKFSATCVAEGSVVLSKAIEKNCALEAEASRLRHHVSDLSKRLHATTREKKILESTILTFQELNKGEPAGDKVTEEVEITDATEEVADNREEVRPAREEVAKGEGVANVDEEAEPGKEVAEEYNRYA